MRFVRNIFLVVFILIAISILIGCDIDGTSKNVQLPIATDTPPKFDGERALQHVRTQLEFGPRTPGSEGHEKIVSWVVDELQINNWDVSVQEIPSDDYTIRNVVAKQGRGAPWIILGAHYDTRFFADNDPDLDNRTQPVPGANDGASGVAVLLELARVLPKNLPGEVWLVFFDAEDNGRIPGWNWIMGSQAFVQTLDDQPDAVVIIDMIGDADQNIYMEKNSDPEISREIWEVAETLGYADRFIANIKYSIMDDHTPFLRAGIPAIDVIDFDYPHWHTVEDTLDKISAQSLQAVGDVLFHWLQGKMSAKTTP